MMEKNKLYMIIAIAVIAVVVLTLFAWNFVATGGDNLVGASAPRCPKECQDCLKNGDCPTCLEAGACESGQCGCSGDGGGPTTMQHAAE